MIRKILDISIISDAHVGTYACHAYELLQYLKSIQPEVLILNGDFIDRPSLKKKQFPKTHREIIDEVFNLANKGTKVYYITSKREAILKRFPKFRSGLIDVRHELTLHFKNEKYWIFHGKVLDPYFMIPSFLIGFENWIYNALMKGNKMINRWRAYFDKPRGSYFGDFKKQVKKSAETINRFESLAIEKAKKNECDYVICGHVHQPVIRKVEESSITYMNSGDWVENLSALEYCAGRWALYEYDELDYIFINPRLHVKSKKMKLEPLTPLKAFRFGSIVGNKERRSNQI